MGSRSMTAGRYEEIRRRLADGRVTLTLIVAQHCMAHARRKFYQLHANHQSQIAGEALEYYGALYQVERKGHEPGLDAEGRRTLRQAQAAPVAEKLHAWLTRRLAEVAPDGSEPLPQRRRSAHSQ
jgi:hypothetical protein